MENSQILRSKKYIFLEYFAVFIIIFYAGKGSLFVNSIQSWEDPIGLLLPIVIIGLLGILKNVQLSSSYWLLILGYVLFFIASSLKFRELHPRFFGVNFIYFTIAFVVVSSLRYRFFDIYINILYYLCIIAIVFWFIQNIIPSTFIEFLRVFEFSSQGVVKGNVDFNTIVYTVSNFKVAPDMILEFGGVRVFRNAGFAWEPGAFATYINIAIFFNLVKNKFRLKGNKQFWVFVTALASTFSTTGYSLFILLILFYSYNQGFVRILWLSPFVIALVIYLFTRPFMAEKISKNAVEYDTQELIYLSIKYDRPYSPQRFQSLQIDFIDFLNHPFIGYGGHPEARWTNKLGAQIFTVSGIGNLMAQYGLTGIFFFLISLWKSSKQIITLYNVKGTLFPVLFLILIAISYSIFELLLMCIWLICFTNFMKIEFYKKFLASKAVKTNT